MKKTFSPWYLFAPAGLLILSILLLASCSPTGTEIPTISLTSTPSPSSPPPSTVPHPILGDLRVRQAIAYCTDRDGLLYTVYPWLEDISPYEMDSILPSGHPFYAGDDPDFPRYPYDPALGAALLEEAGWTLAENETYRKNTGGEELVLTLTTSTAEFRKTYTAAFIEQMKTCGIHVEANYIPAEEFFGEGGTLQMRAFELGALSLVAEYAPDLRSFFACARIPNADNSWEGHNYSGWCNEKADEAIRTAETSIGVEERQSALLILQEEYARDLPGLPLFQRMSTSATRADMENFSPRAGEVYTWNAAEWSIPGKDTIVIGERSEPAGLHPLDTSWVNLTVHALIDGLDYIKTGTDYEPVSLDEFPTLENGGTVLLPISVEAGTEVVNADGNVVQLAPGVKVINERGEEITYSGDALMMNRLLSTYQFLEGLTWSDGVGVTREDYQLAYKILCAPEAAGEFNSILPACSYISNIDFDSDTSYTVAWKPGYRGALYFLPPIGRQPAHRMTEYGRLDEVAASDWEWLDEVNTTPIGIGPYMLTSWEYGQEMVFTANTYYFGGTPATPEIIIRFIPQPETGDYLLRGEIDVLDWTSLLWDEMSSDLLQAEEEGKIRLYFTPDLTFELIDFALFIP